MSKNKPIENTISELSHGDIEAVVFLKTNPYDRFRYPAFTLRRRTGGRAAPHGDFFEYDAEDIINAIKDARAFIKRYQHNPRAAIADDGVANAKRKDVQQNRQEAA